ncbi:MAG: DNA helicase, partial [Cyclobacteriaceae bacterium]
MIDNKVAVLIGKAIREGKYLNISYKNKSGEITLFWISILDIRAKDELLVNIFNVTKDDPILNAKIYVSGIQSAEILKFSHYDVPENLIRRLEEDESLQMYDGSRYSVRILNYYLECYKANKDPFLHKTHLISGVDLSVFENEHSYSLTGEQQKQIIKEVYQNDFNKYYDYELALSEFSIDILSKGKFVVAFRKLTFDPVNKKLHLGSKPNFNPNFYIEKIRYTLSYYTDLSPADFEAMYLKSKSDTIELIKDNFKTGELPNTRPEVVVLGYAQIDIS